MPVTTFQDLRINYHDRLEYESLTDEVFKSHSYYVDLPTNTPLIVDVGAHIGVSLLYFHRQYPQAKFICIEPHPQNLYYLHKNIADNGIENVSVIEKAVVGKKETREIVQLYSNNQLTVFSSLHKGGWTGDEKGEPIDVPTLHLSEILDQHVDVLKLDIEGMEIEVLREVAEKLKNVDTVLCEFHKTKDTTEKDILLLLKPYFSHIEIVKDKRKERDSRNQLFLIEARKK